MEKLTLNQLLQKTSFHGYTTNSSFYKYHYPILRKELPFEPIKKTLKEAANLIKQQFFVSFINTQLRNDTSQKECFKK